MNDKARVQTQIRLPVDIYEWLKGREEGMNATIIEAIRRMRAEEESEDYRRGFMNGYEKGKREKNET